jgi:transcriptional regulator with XRE-family HTH domain
MAQEDSKLIDEFVGSRMRNRRLAMGLSQKELGDAIGASSKDVEGYEIGVHRVGAYQLVHIASALEVELDFFFESDMPEADDSRASRAEVNAKNVVGFIASAEGLELIRAFIGIEDPQLRRHFVALVKQINPGNNT